ncbi:hypothetical protein CONCODRAFT_75546 [Conidiobolus coronatus NRRL 28638]|uniref:ornithine decarboxylase n=1 Tax=Conidiobolus coronatus (strain ATCC 28846 / CBS 209.66 / NRRL 28638) TaxID=796925 RepID=A0A137P7P4_CONC2|nr:hypothetical protein CONCODRAFT_75546 [Conidiobolus coronatus NRRL 28638]|eukprot:KXN71033.1 hypothetical protein CONCODRAFT_75546 [Conidiobolus coronatus NRRL 28638]
MQVVNSTGAHNISNGAPKIPMKKSSSHSSILNVKKSLFNYSFGNDRNTKLISIDGGDSDESFFVADLGSIEGQINYWNKQMPGITPYYAVKCNQDRKVLALMASMGIGFDCASRNEIQMVISLGVHPERIVYANPCKPISHLKYAHSVGVRKFTFDNYEELLKVKKYLPNGQAIIRVLTDDSKSLCPFGTKFGVHPKLAPKLLDQAKELGIDMLGVSFHVGSGCKDVRSYDDAILRARKIFDYASSIGYKMSFLDIGGGFPGHPQEGTSLPEISQVVFCAIQNYFPKGIQIIAEPGRFLVSQSMTLFSNVTSKRKVESIDGTRPASDVDFMYYLTDGVYGCFNNTVFDHYTPRPIAFRQNDEYISDPSQLVVSPCSIWGPTCDSIDVITKKALLPELFVGDWIMFHHMGAYTVAAASTFQSQPVSRIVYTNSLSGQIPKTDNLENWPSVQSFERDLMN